MKVTTNFLPGFLKSKINKSSNVRKIVENVGWLFFDKIFRMGLGLIVGIWVARYLGPSDFGLFNYAKSFVLLLTALASLGLQGLVVRELVKNESDKNLILGTGFIMRVFGGILVMILSLIIVRLWDPNNTLLHYLVLIFSGTMLFKSSEIIAYWFESQVQSKFQVWSENFVFSLSAILKILLILYKAPLIMFAWAFLLEAGFVAAVLFGMYRYKRLSFKKWSFSYHRFYYFLKEGWPLILAGLSIMLYMQVDKIMIGKMMSDEDVGLYSVAVQISEVWYFIPTILASSVFPSLIKTRENNEQLYKVRVQKLLDTVVIIALVIAIPMTFLSDSLISILFGKNYIGSGDVLSIHIWAGVFVFLGVASSKWFLIENLQKFSFYRTAVGGIMNVLLNFILIPKYGILGSAIATVISQALSSVFLNMFSVKVRPLFLMQVKAMIPFRSKILSIK